MNMVFHADMDMRWSTNYSKKKSSLHRASTSYFHLKITQFFLKFICCLLNKSTLNHCLYARSKFDVCKTVKFKLKKKMVG